jgi:3-oxoacyl-[acyl-carrier-protein] synthase-3
MVKNFKEIAQITDAKAPSNAAELGNLVSPCTLKLFHDDVMDETVSEGDEVCFSVVGAGPERGAFRLRSSVVERVRAEDFLPLAA